LPSRRAGSSPAPRTMKEPMTDQPLKVQFAPGCFDDFEGTQEELDLLMAEIHSMFENMTAEDLEATSSLVDFEQLTESDPELAQRLAESLDSIESGSHTRILQ
jgi:hypothetical protein